VAPASAWTPWLLLAGILVGTVFLRTRLLAVPLERDEGEYAYVGQLILQGEVPYLAAHNMKLPGTYYANAAILWLLGESAVAVRVGLLAINLLTIVVLFLLARRLLDARAAVVAAAAYALLSVTSGVLGFTANAEHFVVLPAVAGTMLLVGLDAAGAPPGRLVAAGALFGVAYVMKQHGAAFVAFGALWVLVAGRRRGAPWGRVARDLAVFGAAALVPFLAVCAAMYRAGAFPAFWFWTVTYAREYAVLIPLDRAVAALGANLRYVLGTMTALWALAALGATALVWDRVARRHVTLLALLAVCSCAAVLPGLRFSQHYFILCLPAASLLAGVAASALARRGGAALAVAVPVLAIAASLFQDRAVLFRMTPTEVSRACFGPNPFPEAIEIARWLRERTTPEQRIAVIGSEPEIYFYAGRRAATSYIYMYPLMEPHPFARRMQEEMIAQLEAARPPYVVVVNVDATWAREADSPTLLFDWANRSLAAGYRRVGLTEIGRGAEATHHWGDAAAATRVRSRAHVVTFERRAAVDSP
jgi:hypothetical protein